MAANNSSAPVVVISTAPYGYINKKDGDFGNALTVLVFSVRNISIAIVFSYTGFVLELTDTVSFSRVRDSELCYDNGGWKSKQKASTRRKRVLGKTNGSTSLLLPLIWFFLLGSAPRNITTMTISKTT